ncbi:MAG: YlxM family DNA-binding protein [Oscillospiraceae bacterium]|nr:YlxM family DNA-binding protein [Oscillospiraceae bacterium]
MVTKNLEISILLDYYGGMLTEKQREVVEWYYNDDLSLAEIAEHTGITRQGVRDSIKRAEAQLIDCESRMGLRTRFECIQKYLDEITDQAAMVQDEVSKVPGGGSVYNRAQRIIELTDQIAW